MEVLKISQRGAYRTAKKDAVETVFEMHPDECLSVDDCARYAEESGLHIGRTTVYRSIARLVDSGRVRRFTPVSHGDAAYYQFNSCTEEHLHMVCRMCGKLQHLHCADVEVFRAHLQSEHDFKLDEAQTILYGLCAECAHLKEEADS